MLANVCGGGESISQVQIEPVYFTEINPYVELQSPKPELSQMPTEILLCIADQLLLAVKEDRRALHALSETSKRMYAVVHDSTRISNKVKVELKVDSLILSNHKWNTIRDVALFMRYADSIRALIRVLDLRIVRVLHSTFDSRYPEDLVLRKMLQIDAWKHLIATGLLIRAKLRGYGPGLTIVPVAVPEVSFDDLTWLEKTIFDYTVSVVMLLFKFDFDTNPRFDSITREVMEHEFDDVGYLCSRLLISGGPVHLHWLTVTDGYEMFDMLDRAQSRLDQMLDEAGEERIALWDSIERWDIQGGPSEALRKLKKGRCTELDLHELSQNAVTGMINVLEHFAPV